MSDFEEKTIRLMVQEGGRLLSEVERLQAENTKLRERCDTCDAMLDCDECLRADASHKELRGLQAENDRLRKLCKDMLVELACEFAEKTHDWPDASWPWWDRAEECGIEVGK